MDLISTALLFPAASRCTSAAMSNSEIFDRALRRKRRDRAARNFEPFLLDEMLGGITDRLHSVNRTFSKILDLGTFDGRFTFQGAEITRLDAGARFAAQAAAVQGDEDLPHFPDGSFDLVISAGVLDQVNDVPGALALIRRALKPDGLFLGAFLGAGTLSTLRSVLREAEGDRPAARFHPQIDVRAGGDLLSRAGFTMPVSDLETLQVRYSSIFGLFRDLRGTANTNLLPGTPPLTRTSVARAAQLFADKADPNGRTTEQYEIIYLTGWAPDASQPKPARRGSATASLIDALKPRPQETK